ncbi:MAG TPA: carboxypeptidase regulatory-like domain-containing protein, partial [Actinobacteria bacterium]|nr:carboxypeptidase regulatory-like domain-containing protein [Actinomycetes bacterium]HEX21506.1 carboxypeptidase regulatory-like domain-containing protein [Actinomycetota bacterium]
MFGEKGFAFIDSIIALTILLVSVLALTSLFVFATNISENNKLKTIAVNLAGQKIEKIKSLQFSDVGLENGNPPGLLQHNISQTVNGIVFNIKTQVRWVDDASDGLTPQDSDPRDYKQATVDVSWQAGSLPGVFKLSTAIAKQSEDQIAQGGNIDVIVKDTAGALLEDAKVDITTGPSSPVNDWTDAAGKVFFAMLQASNTVGDYSLTVSKSGYIVRPDLVLQTTTIANGETRSLEFIMAKPGSLSVTLVDPLGNTIQKQSKLTLNNPDSGQVKFNQPNGYFDIQQMFPGSWEVIPFATSYDYTGAPITVEILPNNSASLTITMTPKPQGELKLNVYDGVTGNKIPDDDVTITDIATSDAITAKT